MPQLIEPLVKAGVPIECLHLGQTPLQYAINNGEYDGAEALVLLNAKVNSRRIHDTGSGRVPPLHSAVFSYLKLKRQKQAMDSQLSKIKQLIDTLINYGADPNLRRSSSGSTTLAIAAQEGATHIVYELLQAGANPNQLSGVEGNQVTALEVAIFNNSSNFRTVEMLLYAGADPTTGPHAQDLLEQAGKNIPEAVPLLKQYGAR